MRRLIVFLTLLGSASLASAQTPLAARLDAAIKAAGVPITGVSIGDQATKATWRVDPSTLQAAAQRTIDTFDATNPAFEQAELTAAITAMLDTERLQSAVVWALLRTLFPTDTLAQTKTKYLNIARPQIINAYTAQPWK